MACAHAGVIASSGSSNQYRSEDGVGNYNFGYDENHSTGGSFRRESGNAAGIKSGSYGLRDADGRVRVVNYVADGAGFRAAINTNEPGTAPSAPASAAYNAAPAAVAAPTVAVAASYAAPTAVVAPAQYAHVAHSHAAPVAHYSYAPVAHASSYSTAVNHGSVALSSPYAAHPNVHHVANVGHYSHVAAPVATPVHHYAHPAVATYAAHVNGPAVYAHHHHHHPAHVVY